PVLEVEIVPESVRRAQDDLDAVGGETRVVDGDEAQVEADKAAAALRRKQAEVEGRQREVERKLKGEPDPDNADRVRTKPRGETDEATSDGGQERTGDTESSTVMPEETRADGVEPAAAEAEAERVPDVVARPKEAEQAEPGVKAAPDPMPTPDTEKAVAEQETPSAPIPEPVKQTKTATPDVAGFVSTLTDSRARTARRNLKKVQTLGGREAPVSEHVETLVNERGARVTRHTDPETGETRKVLLFGKDRDLTITEREIGRTGLEYA